MEIRPVITSRRSLLATFGLALPAAALTTSGAIAATMIAPHKAKPHHTAAAAHKTTTHHVASAHKAHTAHVAQVHHTAAHKPT